MLKLKYRNNQAQLENEIKEVDKFYKRTKVIIQENNMDIITRRCDICSINFHRSSYAKHLRSKKHLEQEKQN